MMKPYAMREEFSRGRRHPEDEFANYRGLYRRDIDRVIHSRAFKRLAGKTQVITGRRSDHHRTRLTHSIEVSTLCRSVALQLGLNPDLAACLGFSHDLGHPPLGHSGEDVLNEICVRYGDQFEHNRHTLTIVDEFEQKYASCPGLNLSFEVREGIVKHSAASRHNPDPTLAEFDMAVQPPLESQLVDDCDEICYCYSDLDDGLEAGFLTLESQLDELPEFGRLFGQMRRQYPAAETKLVFNETLRRMMNRTAGGLIEHTRQAVSDAGVDSVEGVRLQPGRLVSYPPEQAEWMRRLKAYLRTNYYEHPQILGSRQEYVRLIRKLYGRYEEDPQLLPARYREMIAAGRIPRHKVIVYYIAGFTDYYFFQCAEKLGL